jgi:hypothetical protein
MQPAGGEFSLGKTDRSDQAIAQPYPVWSHEKIGELEYTYPFQDGLYEQEDRDLRRALRLSREMQSKPATTPAKVTKS